MMKDRGAQAVEKPVDLEAYLGIALGIKGFAVAIHSSLGFFPEHFLRLHTTGCGA
jgi:hypothetical protein